MLGLMDSHDNCNYEKYLCTALEGKLGFPLKQISINVGILNPFVIGFISHFYCIAGHNLTNNLCDIENEDSTK